MKNAIPRFDDPLAEKVGGTCARQSALELEHVCRYRLVREPDGSLAARFSRRYQLMLTGIFLLGGAWLIPAVMFLFDRSGGRAGRPDKALALAGFLLALGCWTGGSLSWRKWRRRRFRFDAGSRLFFRGGRSDFPEHLSGAIPFASFHALQIIRRRQGNAGSFDLNLVLHDGRRAFLMGGSHRTLKKAAALLAAELRLPQWDFATHTRARTARQEMEAALRKAGVKRSDQ